MSLENSTSCLPYTTYLFDFDYTLADSSKGILKCFRIVLNRHQYLNISDDEIKKTIGMTLEDSFSQLTGIKDRAYLVGLKAEYVEEAREIMTINTFLYPDTLPLMKRLKQKGAQTGIISTKQRLVINESIEKYSATNLFDVIIGIEDVRTTKPDPEGIRIAMNRLGVKPDNVLYFGDSLIDAQTAMFAGVDFVAVTTGVTTANDFIKYPYCHIVANLSEVIPIFNL